MRKPFSIVTSLVSLIPWIYALLERFTSKDWIMLIVDVVIPPVGVIDGIGLFLGFW